MYLVMANNCINPVHQALSYLISGSALVLNVILFILIKNRTTPVMKSYKKVLYTSWFLDTVGALMHLLIMVVSLFIKGFFS